jgi:LVIVD repeat-containing protein
MSIRPVRIASPIAVMVLVVALIPATPAAGQTSDPRPDLGAGWLDAEEASWNVDLLAHRDKPEGFVHPDAPTDPAQIGSINFANSDIAFRDHYAFVGSYRGFNIYDIADPDAPALVTSVLCPGGQGDMTVYNDLLFMSVEQTSARIDCGTQGAPGSVNPDRFRGVRIFDVSDLQNPVQLAAVQTCRGSHTHTLVTSPSDPANIYIYNSGTSSVRSGAELAGCTDTPGGNDPDSFLDGEGNPIFTSRFQVEVIQVPLAAPETAAIVNHARLMADPVTGNQHGLWAGGNHGEGTQSTTATNACHDITAYPAIGLAAGACQGNGILIDISDPVHPVRLDQVTDPNFAFWHSATFNNDGTKVLFTDEWGGGTGARCRTGDPISWGANAIFDIVDGELQFASHYKLPVTQTGFENCVAHNGSLLPVPGRDIMIQAWYQGGISVLDFTDSANPVEIAFFDRGPVVERTNGAGNPLATLGGFWSAYYYRGNIFGSEIARGFDVLELTESEHLAEAELAVAAQVQFDRFNTQSQPELAWPASFTLVRAKLVQAVRTDTLSATMIERLERTINLAERQADRSNDRAAAALLRAAATQLDEEVARQAELAGALQDLAGTLG